MGKVTKSRFLSLKKYVMTMHPNIPIEKIARAVRKADLRAPTNAYTYKVTQLTEHFLVKEKIGEAPETELFLKENKKSKQPLKHLKMFEKIVSSVYLRLYKKATHLNKHAFGGKCMITSTHISTALSKAKWLYHEEHIYREAESLVIQSPRLLSMTRFVLKQTPYDNSATEQGEQFKAFLSSIRGDGRDFSPLDYFIEFLTEKREERIFFRDLKQKYVWSFLPPQQEVPMVDVPHIS